MPSSILDDLIEAYGMVSAVNRAMLERFALLAQQFQQERIPFIVLKGADVISRLYGMRGARPISDVDLLVRQGDLPTINRFLTSRGFIQQIDGNPSYASSDLGLSLDLVTSLWYLDEQGLPDVWSRAIRRPFPPGTITCLSTEDLLIHLTAYAVVHRGQLSAAFSHDLRLLIEKEAPDWPAIMDHARRYDLRMPLLHGLRHVRTVFSAVDIPAYVFSRLAPENRREAVLHWLLRRLVTGEPLPEVGHLLLLLTRRRGTRLSGLVRTLFPPATFLSYRYGAEGLTAPWKTRLIRLCRLSASGLLLSIRLIRRLTATPARQAR